MSKTLTRNEIKAEMETLAEQITQLKSEHAEQIAGLESEKTALIESETSAKAEVEKLTADIAEVTEAKSTLEIKLTDAESKVEALTAEKAESDSLLAKAKSALANPAHADASIIPTEINQTVEDAEADQEQASASGDQPDVSDLTVLEQYEQMEAGPDRVAFINANERAIYAEMKRRNEEA